MSKQTISIHFSATGTTSKTVNAIAKTLAEKPEQIDLLRTNPLSGEKVAPDAVAVVGMPVYSGRIPAFARRRLENIHGDGTPAIAVVVYGNRAYDDALVELTDVLTGNGFNVFAAAAFLGEHSIFPKVAAGRPDAADMTKIEEFAKACADRLASGIKATAPIQVKGNRPYLEPKAGSGLQPTVDHAACIRCGACVKICPTGSLVLSDGSELEKDAEMCIPCSACVKVCPKGAQAYRGDQYEGYAKVFGEKNAERREPETFFA